jgi:hypothetical protein
VAYAVRIVVVVSIREPCIAHLACAWSLRCCFGKNLVQASVDRNDVAQARSHLRCQGMRKMRAAFSRGLASLPRQEQLVELVLCHQGTISGVGSVQVLGSGGSHVALSTMPRCSLLLCHIDFNVKQFEVDGACRGANCVRGHRAFLP